MLIVCLFRYEARISCRGLEEVKINDEPHEQAKYQWEVISIHVSEILNKKKYAS